MTRHRRHKSVRGVAVALATVALGAVAALGPATSASADIWLPWPKEPSPTPKAPAPDPGPANLVNLHRWLNGADHATLPQTVAGQGIDEAAVGVVSTTPEAGTRPLYRCLVGGWDEMTSLDPACEGTQYVGLIGYAWVDPRPGYTALRRCTVRGTGDHFDSLDAACEGQNVEPVLGYLAPATTSQVPPATPTPAPTSPTPAPQPPSPTPTHSAAALSWSCVAQQFRFAISAQRGSVPAGTTWTVTAGTWPYDGMQVQVSVDSPLVTVSRVNNNTVSVRAVTDLPQGSVVQVSVTNFVIPSGQSNAVTITGAGSYGGGSLVTWWRVGANPCGT